MTKPLDDVQFLKDLQQELKTQNNDGQAAPRFWTIGDYKTVACREGDHEEIHVTLPKRDYHDSLEDLMKSLEEDVNEENGYSNEAIEEFQAITDDIDTLDWLQQHYDEDAEFVPVKEEFFVQPSTLFLTKAEAKKHIELNHYHYSDRAHTYAMTAWRAPKVARLLQILENVDWDNLPTDALKESE